MSPTADATTPEGGAAGGEGAFGPGGGDAGRDPGFEAATGADSPSTSSTTRTLPTGTTSPSPPRTSTTLPGFGAPMVTVALSVITSTMSWFSETEAPTCTSHPTI